MEQLLSGNPGDDIEVLDMSHCIGMAVHVPFFDYGLVSGQFVHMRTFHRIEGSCYSEEHVVLGQKYICDWGDTC